MLSHTYFPSMVAVHFSSSQIAIFILRAFSGKQQYNFTGSFCSEEAKRAKCSNQFQFSEQDKGSNHCYHFVKFAVLICQHGSIPTPFPLQELSSGADRPLSGSRGGQSPGCLVQTKASHIALLCLLTTWLCHQVL